MPKIKAVNIKGLLIRYIIKITVSSVISVSALLSLLSLILLKLDIDLDICKYAAIGVVFICAFIISYISIGEFKNNLFPLALISVFPLMLVVIINFCLNGEQVIFLIIKTVLIIISSLLAVLLRLKAGKR